MSDPDRPPVVNYGTRGHLDDSGSGEPTVVDIAGVEFQNGVRFYVEGRPGTITEKGISPTSEVHRHVVDSDTEPEAWLFGVLAEYFTVDYPGGLVDASPALRGAFRGVETDE